MKLWISNLLVLRLAILIHTRVFVVRFFLIVIIDNRRISFWGTGRDHERWSRLFRWFCVVGKFLLFLFDHLHYWISELKLWISNLLLLWLAIFIHQSIIGIWFFLIVIIDSFWWTGGGFILMWNRVFRWFRCSFFCVIYIFFLFLYIITVILNIRTGDYGFQTCCCCGWSSCALVRLCVLPPIKLFSVSGVVGKRGNWARGQWGTVTKIVWKSRYRNHSGTGNSGTVLFISLAMQFFTLLRQSELVQKRKTEVALTLFSLQRFFCGILSVPQFLSISTCIERYGFPI